MLLLLLPTRIIINHFYLHAAAFVGIFCLKCALSGRADRVASGWVDRWLVGGAWEPPLSTTSRIIPASLSHAWPEANPPTLPPARTHSQLNAGAAIIIIRVNNKTWTVNCKRHNVASRTTTTTKKQQQQQQAEAKCRQQLYKLLHCVLLAHIKIH